MYGRVPALARDVAMDDSLPVSVVERLGDLASEPERVLLAAAGPHVGADDAATAPRRRGMT